jgi:hypothetical protein
MTDLSTERSDPGLPGPGAATSSWQSEELSQVLVLFADHSGSGRWTGALRLLSTVSEDRLTIRRIRRESGDNFEMAGLRRYTRTGWILDLRDPDESMPVKADFGHELHQNQDLRTNGSYLVVVVSTELWEQIGDGASTLAERLVPPDPLKLFTAFLRSVGVMDREAWAERFKPRIGNLRPGQIREWARALGSSYSEYLAKNGRAPAASNDAGGEEIAETVRLFLSAWAKDSRTMSASPGSSSMSRTSTGACSSPGMAVSCSPGRSAPPARLPRGRCR